MFSDFSSKSLVIFEQSMFSADFVESNWKKVVTLKTECDNLILCNFQIILVPLTNSSYGVGFMGLILPGWNIFTPKFAGLGLLQPLMEVALGWAIFALTNISLREGGFL